MQNNNPDFLTRLIAVQGNRAELWMKYDQGVPVDLSYHANEFGGECGEVQNEIKKLVREAKGLVGSRTTPEKLGEEMADALITLATLIHLTGVDIETAVALKFNKVSSKMGFTHRFYAGQVMSPAGDYTSGTDVDVERLSARAACSEGAHQWEYSGYDYHGSHKGEDSYRCTVCHRVEYRK